jgi:hypothetical protein
MAANLCVNLFTGAASSTHQELDTDGVVRTYSPPVEHDGNCVCDGLDPNCTLMDTPSLDETVKMLKDFQLSTQRNGDIIVYSLIGNDQVYVGTYKKGTHCDIVKMIEQFESDND